MNEPKTQLGPGMSDYRDAAGRQVAHRLQFPRENISEPDFPVTMNVTCMCGLQHKVTIILELDSEGGTG